MARWSDFEASAPGLATAVQARFESHLHHVLGTLSADGSPRLSGTEARFHDGQLWLGCMPASVKARDLRRDARFALHSAPIDVEMIEGDAKVCGVVSEVADLVAMTDFMIAIGHGAELEAGTPMEPGIATAFVCDVHAVTLTKVADDHLNVTTWTIDGGLVVRAVT